MYSLSDCCESLEGKLIFRSDIEGTRLIKQRAKLIPFMFVTFDQVCLSVKAIGRTGLADQ